jgi:FMN phosphatase YigB (HAD superfamily)
MTPEVVVFDLGKVLVDFDYSIAAQKIAAQSKLSAQQVRAFLDESPLFARFETGLLTNQEFLRELCARTGFKGLVLDIADYFADIFTEITPMLQVHARLRARKVPTYVLSNTNDLSISHIRCHFPFYAHFDGYVLSYQHKAMKPEQKLYEALETLCGRSGPQILYLDDRLENAEAGKARGWQVIHHQSPEQSIQRMKELGVLMRHEG